MRSGILVSLLAAFSCAGALAQSTALPWIAYGGDGLMGFPPNNLPWAISVPVSRAVADDGEIYYSKGAGEVWEMRTVVPRLARLGTAPGSVTGLCVTDDRVWFATSGGRIGSFLRGLPLQAPAMLVDLPSVGVTGTPERLATDGRELFVFTLPSPGQTANLFALDTENGGLPVRAVATIGSLACDRVGASGDLWVAVPPLDFARLDPWTGAQSGVVLATPVGNQHVAMDPWEGKALAAMHITYPAPYPWLPPYSYTFFNEGDLATGAWQPPNWMFGGLLERVAAMGEAPYTIHGRGCVHGQQVDMRMAFAGRPQQGGTIVLRVRQGEPLAGTLVWLGVSGTHWAPLGPLPADLGAFGAPGCRILASVEILAFTITDGAGAAAVSFPVPVNPALAGLRLHGQAACATAANALGWATSDAVHVRLR